MTTDAIVEHFAAKKVSNGYLAKCPAHDDHTASLSIGPADNGGVLLNCFAGCDTSQVVEAAGLKMTDLAPEREKKQIVATYDYTDEAKNLLYQVVRFDPKDFRQRRPDGAGGWTWTLGNVRRVLFGLADLKGQKTVAIVEGEKDALALRTLGIMATTNAGGASGNLKKPKWLDAYTQQLVAAGVTWTIVFPDNDAPGFAHAEAVAASCHAAGLKVKVVRLPGIPAKGDISDYIAAGHVVADLVSLVREAPGYTEQAQTPPPPPPPETVIEELPKHSQAERYALASVLPAEEAIVTYELATTEKGRVKTTLDNVRRVITKSHAWGQFVWYDSFRDRVMIHDKIVREWCDADDVDAAIYLQSAVELDSVTPAQVHAVMDAFCRDFQVRHPVKQWLDGLTWDSTPRVARAFVTYWGVEIDVQMPEDYITSASKNFFVSLVARIYRPGCQCDTMPVFEGNQGIRKSSSLRALAGDFYMVQSDSVTSKDFFQTLQGKWLVEIGEMDAFSRADVTRVKTVISTPTDRYRNSYGRSAADHHRQCVFAGTTNKEDWGNDETGLRRFWPVKCGTIDVDAILRDRDQLFAEAVHLLNSGVDWWTMPARETEDVQSQRQFDHAWTDTIVTSLSGLTETTIAHLLGNILKFEAPQMNRQAQLIVGGILRNAGWVKKNKYRDGRQQKVWIAPHAQEEVF